MGSIDWPLEKLRDYRPELTAADDFEAFWQQNLTQSSAVPLNAEFVEREGSLPGARVYDAAFDGVDGVRVRGWFLTPLDTTRPRPAVVRFIGYSGGRAYPHTNAHHVLNGFCVFIMDSRGQGGNTGMRLDTTHGARRGFITHGILHRDEYYFRAFYLDTVRAVEAVCGRAEVDASRIAVTGGSQGGALAIACASLSDRVKVMAPDVPWLSHFERAVDIAVGPYEEITDFMKAYPERVEDAFRTLSYFDNMNLVTRTQVQKAYYSVGLWDDICPPSTVFASYNRLPSSVERSIEIYRYNKHEGGGDLHEQRKLQWLRESLC
ncbi:MAG: alpha/beta fold hydrolase [bacterium]|nr:alpha/beta fold hydrolase [bacterium]